MARHHHILTSSCYLITHLDLSLQGCVSKSTEENINYQVPLLWNNLLLVSVQGADTLATIRSRLKLSILTKLIVNGWLTLGPRHAAIGSDCWGTSHDAMDQLLWSHLTLTAAILIINTVITVIISYYISHYYFEQ